MASRPRVLQVAATYPPYTGGVETHTREVSRRLADRFEVSVLSTDPSRRLARRERSDDGFDVLRVPSWPSNGDLYFAPDLPRTIAAGGWDLVHLQGYHTLVAPLAMLGARLANAPLVVTFHSGGDVTSARRAMRTAQHLVLRPLLLGARQLIAVSRFERDDLARRLRLARRRFVVIPNGSDLAAADDPAELATGTLVLSVGRLQRYKGHQHLIRALPHLLRARPDARLRIAGSGPEARDLATLAAELGVGDRVMIEEVPAGDRRAMARLYREASVVAVLSEYESQGLAAVEAAALGRPLVVTDGSALHELVDAGVARGVAPGTSPVDVAGALLTELTGPPRSPTRPRSWDDCAAELAAVYERILRTAA